MTSIVVLVLILLVILILVRNIRIVQQAKAYVIERLGAYKTTWNVGIHLKVPFIERVAKIVTLKEQVAIAAQLDATGITITMLNKKDKVAKKIKDCKKLQVGFTIARNVTATNGNRTFYVRIQTPTGQVLGEGTFTYENRQLEYSIKKVAEYTGEELTLQTYWTGENTLIAGDYRVSIFAEGNMIGTRTFTLN